MGRRELMDRKKIEGSVWLRATAGIGATALKTFTPKISFLLFQWRWKSLFLKREFIFSPNLCVHLWGKKIANCKYVHYAKRLKTNFIQQYRNIIWVYCWMWYSSGSLYDAFLPRIHIALPLIIWADGRGKYWII